MASRRAALSSRFASFPPLADSVADSSSLQSGQRLAKPGFPGLSSNSSPHFTQILIGKAMNKYQNIAAFSILRLPDRSRPQSIFTFLNFKSIPPEIGVEFWLSKFMKAQMHGAFSEVFHEPNSLHAFSLLPLARDHYLYLGEGASKI